MKKFIVMILSLMLALGAFGLTACKEPAEPKEPVFTYDVLELDKTMQVAVITGLTEYGKTVQDITIPQKIDDLTVSAIAANAFEGDDTITSVKFAKNSELVVIQDAAFRNCKILTSVVLPNTITKIGEDAFSSCPLLKTVTLSTSLREIADYTFVGCRSLKEIEIPASVTKIGNFAFNGCTTLTSVTFAEDSTLSEIGDRAFAACYGLVNMVLPSDLTAIGSYTFMDCYMLEAINIPSKVEKIGSFAFNGCIKIGQITFAKTTDWQAGTIALSETAVSSPETMAEYLTFLHEDKEWSWVEEVVNE